MSPTSAAENAGNRRRVHSEPSRQVPAFSIRASIIASNIAHDFIGQFGKNVTAAFWRVVYPTPLRIHISHVVELSPGKQVRRIAANRVVAFVTNVIVSGVAMRQSVGETMHVIENAAESQFSVSASLPRGRPFPAVIGATSINARPERARERTISLSRYGERLGAVWAMLGRHLPLIADYPEWHHV